MESLILDIEDIVPEYYFSLGLNGGGKETTEGPRVLHLLASLLERAIQKNEKLLEAMKKKESVTVFHGLRAPNLSIRRYIERIFKYSKCSPSCFVLAQVYIDRFLQQPNMHLTSLNVHRLLITSVVVAAKFIDDAFYNNAYYAKVGGVGTLEMNRLELNFLFCLDFRLQVTVGTFDKYCLLLEKEALTDGYQIERPIKVCSLKCCANKEEYKGQEAIRRYSCGAI
uniref:Cyclin-P3-1 n=1 Tax=Anthurium amnicola TaxID=1678845 RepID=A0A1D1ZJ53_9ARAE